MPSAPPTAAGYARFDLHGTHFGVKAYSKDPRLKGLDSVDRGMVCQGMVRREVAHTREALEEAILDALSSVKAEHSSRRSCTAPSSVGALHHREGLRGRNGSKKPVHPAVFVKVPHCLGITLMVSTYGLSCTNLTSPENPKYLVAKVEATGRNTLSPPSGLRRDQL